MDSTVFLRAKLAGDFSGSGDFYVVALAIVERKAVAGIAFFHGNGQGGGGIEAAAEEADGSFFVRGMEQILV